jgi:hypothetical protein
MEKSPKFSGLVDRRRICQRGGRSSRGGVHGSSDSALYVCGNCVAGFVPGDGGIGPRQHYNRQYSGQRQSTGALVHALDNTLTIASTEDLEIVGPSFGGITIDGGGTLELIDAEGTSLWLENLTLADGSIEGGGALFAADSEIGIFNCTFRDNVDAEPRGGWPRYLSARSRRQQSVCAGINECRRRPGGMLRHQ